MRRLSLVLLFEVLLILALVHLANAQQLSGYSDSSTWENLVPGTIVHAEVIEAPDGIYEGVACTDETHKIANELRFEASMQVTARHTILDVRGNLVLSAVNNRCAQILPQRAFQYTDSGQSVYIETRFLRLILPAEMTPISIGVGEHSPDRLVVVIAQKHELWAFEGTNPVLRIPVRMGPTPLGDHRVYRTTVGYDMTGFNAVPWTNDFGGGYNYHGAPWWDWDTIGEGSGGSHGCVNLPGDDWYQIQYGDQSMGPAKWLWRWTAANLTSDPISQDPEAWFTEVDSDAAWEQGVSSVRTIVVDTVYDLYQYPVTRQFGGAAANASVTSWDQIVTVIDSVGDTWLLTNVDQDGTVRVELIPAGISPAESEGRNIGPRFVMLTCGDPVTWDNSAAPGSSRTVGETCNHIYDRGVICTLDQDVLLTMCDAVTFDAATLEIRGELIEHENIHLEQFSGYFGVLVDQGIAGNDPSPNFEDATQLSLVGIAELAAQTVNVGSLLEDDYRFVLASPGPDGQPVRVNNQATTQEAWDHLHQQCGDPGLQDVELQDLLFRGLTGDGEAYQMLEQICSLPPHRLVPDKTR